MLQRIVVVADASVSEDTVEDARTLCAQFADYLGEDVGLATLTKARLSVVHSALSAGGNGHNIEVFTPSAPISAAPMAAAPFIWRDDGRPDWSAMWTGFCELALYGGPPHRGEADALQAPHAAANPESELFAEIRRGIWETTGLYAEPAAEPGWIAITCHSAKMAAWLCATIVLENVYARCEDERLFLPMDESYELKDQVKSIITVLAKTNHYWQAHIEAQEARSPQAV